MVVTFSPSLKKATRSLIEAGFVVTEATGRPTVNLASPEVQRRFVQWLGRAPDDCFCGRWQWLHKGAERIEHGSLPFELAELLTGPSK